MTVPERPDSVFTATAQTTAQAPARGRCSRLVQQAGEAGWCSRLVQQALGNAASRRLAGGFADISFELPRASGTPATPPGAPRFGKAGLRVAAPSPDDTLVHKPV